MPNFFASQFETKLKKLTQTSIAIMANRPDDIATTPAFTRRTNRPPLTYSREDILAYLMYIYGDFTCAEGAPYPDEGPFAHCVITCLFYDSPKIDDVERSLIDIARHASWKVGQHILEYMRQDLQNVPRWCQQAVEFFDRDALQLTTLDALRDYAIDGAESDAHTRDLLEERAYDKKDNEDALAAAETIGQRVHREKLLKKNLANFDQKLYHSYEIMAQLQQMLNEQTAGRVVYAIINAFRELLMNLAEGHLLVRHARPVRPDNWRVY